jgi:tetratricopeptide (TPR) repeat protein
MKPCPSLEQFRCLLAEQLSDADRDEIEAHVEGCDACQRTLEELLRDPTDPRGGVVWKPCPNAGPGRLPGAAETDSAHEPRSDFLRLLKLGSPVPGLELDNGELENQLPSPLGDFRLLCEIGRGGMGVVYEAEQLSLGRRVALKVLPFASTLDAKQLQRFKNEAQAAAHLHHTNIVPVFATGCERGVHYYAMQFIEGQSLANAIAELRANVEERMTNDNSMTDAESRKTEPYVPLCEAATEVRHSTIGLLSSSGIRDSSFFRNVAQLGIQAAEALDHAHQLGIIHRDIKPANLLIEGEPGTAGTGVRLWITDFGLAHMQSQTGLTMTGDLVGTLRYMSPEQALAKRVVVDHRTDIYSLGVTLYELLTLEHAFDGADREELLRQIAFEEPKTPRRINKSIPAELETIVLKAMEKNPAERFASAQELADDLERFLKDEPIWAKRPTVAQRARKWARRHKAVTRALALVLFVVVLAVIVVLWRERDRAEAEKAQVEDKLRAVDEQRQRALANFRVAGDALQAFYLREGENRLVRDQGPPQVPEHMLKLGLQFYERLATENSSEPQAQLEKARAYLQIGEVRGWLGQPSEAESAYREAIRIAENLAAQSSEVIACRELSASSYNNLGALLLNAGRHQEAEKAFRRALALKRELARKASTRPELRHFLANGLQNLAITLKDLGRNREATEAANEAQGLAEALVAAFPGNPNYQANLGAILNTLGQLKWNAGERAEAVRLYRRAIEHGRAGMQGAYQRPRYRQFLGNHHFALGECLFALGDRAGAEKAWREAVAVRRSLADEYPGIVEFLYASSRVSWHLGKLLVDAGRFPDAADLLLQAISREESRTDRLRLKPNQFHLLASLHYLRADAFKLSHRPKEAEPHYLRGLALHQGLMGKVPKASEYRHEMAQGHHNLAIVYWQLQQYETAIASYSDVIKLEPTSARAWNNRGVAYAYLLQYDKAVGDLTEAVRLDPKLAEALVNRGSAYVELHQYDKAIADSSDAIELAPKHFAPWNVRGMAYHGMGLYDKAVADLSTALKWDANRAAPWSNRGNAYRKLKQEEKAVADYSMAIKLDRGHYQAWLGLGGAYSALHKHDEAVAAYKEAARLKPDRADPYWGLGNLGVALAGQGRDDEAINVFKELIRLKPDDAGAHNNLGMSLEAKGLLDQATDAYEAAIRHESQKPPQQQVHDYSTGSLLIAIVHNNLGNALAKKGLRDRAVVAYRDAIRRQQDYAMAYSNLGGALMEKGLLDEGISEHKKAIRLRPNDAFFHYNFGIALAHQGLLDKAVAEYKAAIRLLPGYAGFHCELAVVLRQQERFEESLAAYKRGHELGSKQPNWNHPSAEWAREAERLVVLDAKLAKVLRAEAQPAGAAERIELARFCQVNKRRLRTAVGFYADAFAAEPKLAESLKTQDRYNAACAAVLVSCGQGKDAGSADEKDRARLRRQALDWLRADLAFYTKLADITPTEVHSFVLKRMQHWLRDTGLVGVRGSQVAKLPEAERQDWRQLWLDVEQTLQRTKHKDTKDTNKSKS